MPTASSRSTATVHVALAGLVLFGILLICHVSRTTAFAATCTNSYDSGAIAPVGYAPAWNPLTASRELLLQVTECTASTTTFIVGSGAGNQFIYNTAYHWTGSMWAEAPLTSSSALVAGSWYKARAAGVVPVIGETTHLVALVCQYIAGDWKCGCTDESCSLSRWQLQTGEAAPADTGGGYVASGPDCAGATPPPQASAAGLTRMAFCEDFSDPSRIDFTNTPTEGKTTFVAMRPGNIFSAAAETPSNFTFTPEGTLESRSTEVNYQADFISTWPKGGGTYGGYAVSNNTTGWYVESRMKHNTWSGSKGFYAFWSMATCKIYASGPGCVEPDFYEYIDGKMIHAIHWYPTGGTNDGKKSAMCSVTPNSDRTQFFTTGALYGPGNAYVRWYDNEIMTCEKTSGSYPYLSYMANQDFPIIFGTGPSQPYTIDWIRVWVKP